MTVATVAAGLADLQAQQYELEVIQQAQGAVDDAPVADDGTGPTFAQERERLRAEVRRVERAWPNQMRAIRAYERARRG